MTSKFDILSFHHGDPEKYRGRPAGFYEVLNKEERLGFIVQKLRFALSGRKILIIKPILIVKIPIHCNDNALFHKI